LNIVYYATQLQGDLIDAINDPKDGWQYGENHTTGKYVIITCLILDE